MAQAPSTELDAFLQMLAADVVSALGTHAPLTVDQVINALGDADVKAALATMRARGELDDAVAKGTLTESVRAFVTSRQSGRATGLRPMDMLLKKDGVTK